MPSNRPTILLITADEMNREALSCYGATSHATPNIDRLAESGTLFTSAYTTSPVCLAARCSLATGLYPHNNRSTNNNTGRSLGLDVPNIFTLLGEAGYRTSMHGKCHFIPVPYAYIERDFTREYEHFIHYYRSLGMDHLDLMDDPQVSAWFYDDYAKDMERQGLLAGFRRCVWECHDKTQEFPCPGVFRFPGPDHMQPDSWVGERTLDYIETCDHDGPAFIWMSFGGPHYPTCAPPKYYDLIDMDRDRPRRLREDEWEDTSKSNWKNGGGGNADGDGYAPNREQKNFDEDYWRAWRHGYYASCVQIDDYVGRVVSAARQRWGDHVMVIFTADHGDMMGDHGFWGKGLYDQGTRVPLVVSFPDGSHAGESSDALVQTADLLPTVLGAAGARPSPCDGRELQTWMAEGGRPFAVAECGESSIMITDKRLKYTFTTRGEQEFHGLYDLETDPHEFENVFSQAGRYEGYALLNEELERLQREEGLRDVLFYDGSGAPPWAAL
jgi:arylsulfatase A-like enzyme